MSSPTEHTSAMAKDEGNAIEGKGSEDAEPRVPESGSTATSGTLVASAAPTTAAAPTAVEPAPEEDLAKVTVFNVGLHATLVQFEKILRANGIVYKKAKKTPATSHGVLTFEVPPYKFLTPRRGGSLAASQATARCCVESLSPAPVHKFSPTPGHRQDFFSLTTAHARTARGWNETKNLIEPCANSFPRPGVMTPAPARPYLGGVLLDFTPVQSNARRVAERGFSGDGKRHVIRSFLVASDARVSRWLVQRDMRRVSECTLPSLPSLLSPVFVTRKKTAEERAIAMEKLGKLEGARGGELMYAVLSKQKQRGDKRGAGDGGNGRGDGSKRQRQDQEPRTVAQATASLYGVKTYAEQLAFKEETLMNDLFLRLPAVVRNEWDKRFREWKRNQGMKRGAAAGANANKPAELRCPSWCKMFKRRDANVPFDVLPIVPSPEQEGYRNKCEFTLSLSEDGLATTGFRSGRYQAGVPITVESPKDCPQVHGDMKNLCAQMDTFMRSSPFPLYDDATKKGVWRFLVVRRSVADDETMIMIVINPTALKDADEWKKEEERLARDFSAGAKGEEGTKLVSLWVQEYAGVSSPDETSPMRLVWGKERLQEELLGLRFTISPNSFFQARTNAPRRGVNTKGAEALYRVVIENLELGEDAVVLDVCCGAGTIGICAAAAGGAKRVYGSDLCQPAIEDAKRNAEANGIENCEFVCGKAEAVVGGQIATAYGEHKKALAAVSATAKEEGGGSPADAAPAAPAELKFAAVVDPPRSGVHAKCLRSIRGTKAIKRLVYVSCNPTKSLIGDAVILCTPVSKATTGMPFRPVKAIPVDMFPHTPHMELVMVFERIEYENSEPAASSAGEKKETSAEVEATAGATAITPTAEGATAVGAATAPEAPAPAPAASADAAPVAGTPAPTSAVVEAAPAAPTPIPATEPTPAAATSGDRDGDGGTK
ncbi:unnamed protein product [Scytosiphon promiscuus]